MSEKRGDKVITPSWVAEDMVTRFQPQGHVLDPCRGEGAFTSALANHNINASWCEIDEDLDFFKWTASVDWVIGNPPYSLTRRWFNHSYQIANHLVYLVPLRNIFSGYGFVKEIMDFGGIRTIRVYGTGGRLGFPMGNAIGAFHIEANYGGATDIEMYDEQTTP